MDTLSTFKCINCGSSSVVATEAGKLECEYCGSIYRLDNNALYDVGWRCHACSAENDVNDEFCGKCGVHLVKMCPMCGTELQHYHSFCKACGFRFLAGEVSHGVYLFAQVMTYGKKNFFTGRSFSYLGETGYVALTSKRICMRFLPLEQFDLPPNTPYHEVILSSIKGLVLEDKGYMQAYMIELVDGKGLSICFNSANPFYSKLQALLNRA